MRLNLAAIKSKKGRIVIGLLLFFAVDIGGVVCLSKILKDQVQDTDQSMPISVTKDVLRAAFDLHKSELLGKAEWHFFEAERFESEYPHRNFRLRNEGYRNTHESYVKSVDEFSEALGADSAMTCLVMSSQGNFENDFGRPKVAEAVLRRAIIGLEKRKPDFDTLLSMFASKIFLGNALQSQFKYPEAIQQFIDCIRIAKQLDQREHSQPHCLAAMDDLQICYRTVGRFDKAQQICEEALAVARQSDSQSDCLKAMDTLKDCCFWAKSYDRAQRISEEALAIARRTPDNKKELMRRLVELGDTEYNTAHYSQAIEHCTEAICIDSQSSWAYSSRANAYDGLKEYGHAIEDFTSAIGCKNPPNPWIYCDRAKTFEKMGRYHDAIADYSIYMQPQGRGGFVGAPIDTHDPLLWRANDYRRVHQWQQAISDYSKVIESMKEPGKDLAAVYEERGQTYTALGKPDLAMADRVSAQQATATRLPVQTKKQ